MTKAIETKKQRMQPWSEQEKRDLKHSKMQVELELAKKQQAIDLLEEGQKDLDEEIEGYISEAKLELKKVVLQLRKMEFDKANNITKKETFFQINDAKKEAKRLKGNLEFQEKQIKDGKPILEDKRDQVKAQKEMADAVSSKEEDPNGTNEKGSEKEHAPASEEQPAVPEV